MQGAEKQLSLVGNIGRGNVDNGQIMALLYLNTCSKGKVFSLYNSPPYFACPRRKSFNQ